MIIQPKRRPLIIAGASLALVLVFVSSVNAQSSLKKANKVLNQASNVTSKLKPVLGNSSNEIQSTISEASNHVWQAQQYWNQLSSFYYNLIGGNLEGILGDIQGITGALGIPDPFAIRTSGAWDEQIPGTMSTAQAKANTIDRAIASSIASTILGKDGQSVIREQQQQVATVVEQSVYKAQQSALTAYKAQSRNVTQDILKDVANQQALVAQQQTNLVQVNQQMSGQLTGLQLQGAANNLMLSNISGTLDQQELQHQQQQQANNLSQAQTMAQVFIPGISFSK